MANPEITSFSAYNLFYEAHPNAQQIIPSPYKLR